MTEDVGTERDPDAVARFLERFALALNEAGVPRMPSRVLAALMSSEHSRLTASDLAAQLDVSPAAVSGAVRYLSQVQLILRTREPGDKRDHYALRDDPWYEALTRQDKQLATWQDLLGEGVDAVGPATPTGQRLEQARRFFQFLVVELPGLLDKWRALEHPD